MSRCRFVSPTMVAALVGALLVPSPASACGGLFCSGGPLPVQQTAERIVFADHGDGRMTAIVEILYTGTSPTFAWVLPVADVPEVGVVPQGFLDQLSLSTAPAVQVASVSCPQDSGCSGIGCAAMGTSARSSGVPTEPVVIDRAGSVGPYDYVVISIDPSATDPTTAAREFLVGEGYPVTDAGVAPLGDYLAAGMKLLAFRLQPGTNTNAIRPVALTYDASMPVIPLRPTAVAAVPDTQVLVFLYGASRYVPVTYDEVFIHDSQFISGGFAPTTYVSLVSAAVDEAGGHAFLTEYAGPSPALSAGAPTLRLQLGELETLAASAPDGLVFLEDVADAFRGDAGLVTALGRTLTLPPGVSVEAVVACPRCALSEAPTFDAQAVLDALESDIVAPAELVESLPEIGPHLTRLFTTVDPDEMDVDPAFRAVAGLPDVQAARVVGLRQCGAEVVVDELSYPASPSLPIAMRIVRRRFDGVVRETIDHEDQYLAVSARPGADDGCTAVPLGANLVGTWGPLGVVLAALRRRRRRSAR